MVDLHIDEVCGHAACNWSCVQLVVQNTQMMISVDKWMAMRTAGQALDDRRHMMIEEENEEILQGTEASFEMVDSCLRMRKVNTTETLHKFHKGEIGLRKGPCVDLSIAAELVSLVQQRNERDQQKTKSVILSGNSYTEREHFTKNFSKLPSCSSELAC